MYLFNTMETQGEIVTETAAADTDTAGGEVESKASYEKTMWNRVFREMAAISRVVLKMKSEQEADRKSWTRCYWPRSQTQKQMTIIGHLETIEEIIRFVSMITPYIQKQS